MSTVLSYRKKDQPTSNCCSVWFGIVANSALGLFALRYLSFHHGQIFTQSTGVFLAVLASCSIFAIGFVLSAIDMFVRRRWLMGFLGFVLSATPFPFFLAIFEIIAWFKEFRFV